MQFVNYQIKFQVTISNANTAYVAEGDSLTSSSVPSSYARLVAASALPSFGSFIDNASSGDRLTDLINRAPLLDALLPLQQLNILSVLIGWNDALASAGGLYATPAAYATAIAGYCDSRRSSGWKIILCTIPTQSLSSFPKTTAFNFPVNAILRSWPMGLHFDGLADFGANVVMGDPNSFANYPAYWDQVNQHPNALGQSLLQSIFQPVISNLIFNFPIRNLDFDLKLMGRLF
jgi:hypothetical protein